MADGSTFISFYAYGKPFQSVTGSDRVINGWNQGRMGWQQTQAAHTGAPGLWRESDRGTYQAAL